MTARHLVTAPTADELRDADLLAHDVSESPQLARSVLLELLVLRRLAGEVRRARLHLRYTRVGQVMQRLSVRTATLECNLAMSEADEPTH